MIIGVRLQLTSTCDSPDLERRVIRFTPGTRGALLAKRY